MTDEDTTQPVRASERIISAIHSLEEKIDAALAPKENDDSTETSGDETADEVQFTPDETQLPITPVDDNDGGDGTGDVSGNGAGASNVTAIASTRGFPRGRKLNNGR